MDANRYLYKLSATTNQLRMAMREGRDDKIVVEAKYLHELAASAQQVLAGIIVAYGGELPSTTKKKGNKT